MMIMERNVYFQESMYLDLEKSGILKTGSFENATFL